MLMQKIAERLKVVTDSRYRHFYSQRMIKDIPARQKKADAIASKLPRYAAADEAAAGEKAAALEEDGFVMTPGLIKPEWLPDMVAYFKEKECSDPYRPERGAFRGPDQVPSGTHVAFFSNEVVAGAPHAFAIANDPRVLAVTSKMLGAKPTISYMTAWWSLPADGSAEHAEKFHRDVDDIRFVKLFCYLTDVDETAGPHMFVKGSHRLNTLTEIRRYTDAEIISAFGEKNLVRFTGSAGTSFLENTYGVHRGTPPSKKPRLIFQALYSLRPVIYGPKSPVARAGANGVPAGLDPFVNRIYCAF